MKKIHEYEVLDNSGDKPRIKAKVWWNGRTIESDSNMFLQQLKQISVMGKQFSDGLEFFNNLPFHFRSGYISIKRVK